MRKRILIDLDETTALPLIQILMNSKWEFRVLNLPGEGAKAVAVPKEPKAPAVVEVEPIFAQPISVEPTVPPIETVDPIERPRAEAPRSRPPSIPDLLLLRFKASKSGKLRASDLRPEFRKMGYSESALAFGFRRLTEEGLVERTGRGAYKLKSPIQAMPRPQPEFPSPPSAAQAEEMPLVRKAILEIGRAKGGDFTYGDVSAEFRRRKLPRGNAGAYLSRMRADGMIERIAPASYRITEGPPLPPPPKAGHRPTIQEGIMGRIKDKAKPIRVEAFHDLTEGMSKGALNVAFTQLVKNGNLERIGHATYRFIKPLEGPQRSAPRRKTEDGKTPEQVVMEKAESFNGLNFHRGEITALSHGSGFAQNTLIGAVQRLVEEGKIKRDGSYYRVAPKQESRLEV